MDIKTIQTEIREWAERNFPNTKTYQPLLGLVEEVGELAHAHLKEEQNIRGSAEQHQAAAQDAVGDIFVYLMDYCNKRGWVAEEIIIKVWNQVKQRDWQKHPNDADIHAMKLEGDILLGGSND